MINRIPDVLAVNNTQAGGVKLPENEGLVAVVIGAGLTGTSMSFEVSIDDRATWVPVKALGGASNYSVTVGSAAAMHPLDPDVFAWCGNGHKVHVRAVLNAAQLVSPVSLTMCTKKF